MKKNKNKEKKERVTHRDRLFLTLLQARAWVNANVAGIQKK